MTDFFKYQTPGESTGFLLWKTTNLWQREIKKTLKKFDLTHTQFVVLASTYWLTNNYDNLTQVKIAEFIEIDKMMTSNVIKKLIEKKMIIRKKHKTDSRAKVINLTNKGLDILEKSIQEVENFDAVFFDTVSDKDRFNGELMRLLINNSN